MHAVTPCLFIPLADKNTRVSPDVKALPRGRHNLPPEAVRASQRERLVAAMLASVAERGYAATTVPLVVAEARVSRNAFYALFGDKTDCFLAACEDLAGAMLAEIAAPQAGDWRAALRAGTGRYLRWWAERPGFARAYFVELPTAGQRAIEHRDRQYARFRALFAALAGWAREQDPALPPLSPLALRAIPHAVTEIVGEEVLAGRGARLAALEDDLVDLLALLLAGRAAVAGR